MLAQYSLVLFSRKVHWALVHDVLVQNAQHKIEPILLQTHLVIGPHLHSCVAIATDHAVGDTQGKNLTTDAY